MIEHRLFQPLADGVGTFTHPMAWIFALVCLLCVFTVRVKRSGQPYSPQLAWLRAFAYFSFAIFLSFVCGVWTQLFNQPLFTETQLSSSIWQ
ncbi:MAG: hypothetical protein ACR2PS_04070, partial [Pseudomonadales bacterium]